MESKVLYLIVPCYNEAAVLPETAKRLQAKIETLITNQKINERSRVMFVDDGSKDQTYQIIKDLHQANPLFMGVKLSHNRGHQNALLAGLTTACEHADLMITIDADLQDDIDAINQMLEENAKGAEIVYGVRSSRKKDTFFKRFTAQAFYKLMLKMGIELVYNHADYRLMTKTAVNALLQYKETNLFIRGLIPQLGFQTATVQYERHERFAGESKYPLKKMIALALNGVTSNSTKPLSMIWWFGMMFNILGLAGLITTITLMLTNNLSYMWPIISAMVCATGILLLAMGLIGLYLGKTYIETKHRPRFFIEKVVG